MPSEYSWRDGWFLTYPHPLPPKPEVKFNENIKVCKCGDRQYGENPCVTCAIIERRGK